MDMLMPTQLDFPTIVSVLGNINEIAPFTLTSGADSFIKNTPYEIEFPAAPKSVSCSYAEASSPTDTRLKSIKVKLDGTKATIKTSNYSQQIFLSCNAVYTEVGAGKGSVKFGDEEAILALAIVNNPVMTEGSVKTKGSLEISGVATKALSSAGKLYATFLLNKTTLTSDATCELNVAGTKSEIPIKSGSLVPTDLLNAVFFDLTDAKIEEDKAFSIKCKKDVITTEPIVKNSEVVVIQAGISVSTFNANSAVYVGTVVAVVSSVVSILAVFF